MIEHLSICDCVTWPAGLYSKTVLYSVYDVTAELKASSAVAGKHAVGVELGNGWWNPMTLKMCASVILSLFLCLWLCLCVSVSHRLCFRWGHTDVRGALTVGQGRGNGTTTEPMFRLKLLATMSDGTQKTLLSSSEAGEWHASGSPTTFNNIYLGERYDARKEPTPGSPLAWSTVGFDASSWTKAVPAAEDPATLSLGTLEPQMVPPIRRQGVLSTVVVAKAIPTAPGTCTRFSSILCIHISHIKSTGQARPILRSSSTPGRITLGCAASDSKAVRRMPDKRS